MGDTDKVAILNRTGPGSTPREPLALVSKMSDSERSALESEGRRGGLASAEEPDSTTLPEIQYRTSIQNSFTFFFVTFLLFWGSVLFALRQRLRDGIESSH